MLERKYDVYYADSLDSVVADCFVLIPGIDGLAYHALRFYADAQRIHDPALSAGLHAWLDSLDDTPTPVSSEVCWRIGFCGCVDGSCKRPEQIGPSPMPKEGR